MFKQLMCLGVLLGFVTSLTGCASIMHGTSQEVGISSAPTGASVSINGVDYGKTPLVAKLKRKDNHVIKIELAGYEPYETTLTRKVSGWVWGNIVFGGLIGLVVDAMTGGIYKLTPEQVEAALTKQGMAFLSKDDTLCVAVVLKPDPSWEKIGSLKRKI